MNKIVKGTLSRPRTTKPVFYMHSFLESDIQIFIFDLVLWTSLPRVRHSLTFQFSCLAEIPESRMLIFKEKKGSICFKHVCILLNFVLWQTMQNCCICSLSRNVQNYEDRQLYDGRLWPLLQPAVFWSKK